MKTIREYNNGFKSYYYVCNHCQSQNIEQVLSGGFAPPKLKCNDCGEGVVNNPITIKFSAKNN